MYVLGLQKKIDSMTLLQNEMTAVDVTITARSPHFESYEYDHI